MLVGFGHRRCVGKDSAADVLVRTAGFRKIAIADPIKEGIGRIIFGLSTEQLYGHLKEQPDTWWGLTPREILQRAGTNGLFHAFGEDVLVRALELRLVHLGYREDYVIPDVRFQKEAERIKELGGLVFRIDREVRFDPNKDNHRSETDLADWKGWDGVIENDSTLESFRQKVYVFGPYLQMLGDVRGRRLASTRRPDNGEDHQSNDTTP